MFLPYLGFMQDCLLKDLKLCLFSFREGKLKMLCGNIYFSEPNPALIQPKPSPDQSAVHLGLYDAAYSPSLFNKHLNSLLNWIFQNED